MDEEIRGTERDAASGGDIYTQASLLRKKIRSGKLSAEIVQFAAGLGHPAALLLSTREERTSRWLPAPDFMDSWYRRPAHIYHLNREQFRGDFEILIDIIGLEKSFDLLFFLTDLAYDEFCPGSDKYGRLNYQACRIIDNMLDYAKLARDGNFSHDLCEPARELAFSIRDGLGYRELHGVYWDILYAAMHLGWATNAFGYTYAAQQEDWSCKMHDANDCPWQPAVGMGVSRYFFVDDMEANINLHLIGGFTELFNRRNSYRPGYMLLPLANWLLT